MLSEKILVPVFFVLYLAIGLFIYQDYGISWDEHIQREHGMVTMDYLNEVFGGVFYEGKKSEHELSSYNFRFHGTFYQNLCFFLEELFGIEDDRNAFLLRHLIVFLLFFSGAIAFYFLLRDRFSHWGYALAGVGMLVLSPRIFGHSFYNPKDIVFLAWFNITMWLLWRFIRSKNLGRALLLALVTAILINARVLGILIPVMAAIVLLMEYIRSSNRKTYWQKNYKPVLGFYLGTILLTIAIWPFLWAAPLHNFLFVFESLKQFFWDTDTLYYGEVIRSVNLPWHYVPGWMLVTIPVVYILFFLWGLFFTGKKLFTFFLKKPLRFYKKRIHKLDWLVFMWFFAPLVAVIAFDSTMYDGWRHNYFIYPAFVYFAILGVEASIDWTGERHVTKNRPWLRRVPAALLAIAFVWTVADMIRLHPYQAVYFNQLAGRGEMLDKRFEQEYWALSTREVLEFLVEQDNRETIKVFTPQWSGKGNASMLPPEDRRRLKYVDFQEADYFVYHHRFESAKNQFYQRVFPFNQPLYTVERNGVLLAGLYDMRNR